LLEAVEGERADEIYLPPGIPGCLNVMDHLVVREGIAPDIGEHAIEEPDLLVGRRPGTA